MTNIAILGYGVVGSGVYEVLGADVSSLADIRVKHVFDKRDLTDDPASALVTHNIEDILADDEIHVVVETMGGIEPAYTFTKRALLSGKHVVTSNKALVAAHGTELMTLAESHGVRYLFEAAVGGAIPIIRNLRQTFVSEEINRITGIMNGTTNYILTEMNEHGISFAEALTSAKEMGYAEANPDDDVKGYDPVRKLALLLSLTMGRFVDYKNIHTEGITEITKRDFDAAGAIGATIKLLARAEIAYPDKDTSAPTLTAFVAPCIVPKSSIFYGISDVYNGIMVTGAAMGDIMLYGRGAGKRPTAAAVVQDICEAVQSPMAGDKLYGMRKWSSDELIPLPSSDIISSKAVVIGYGNLVAAREILQRHFPFADIHIEPDGKYIIFVTDPIKEATLDETIRCIIHEGQPAGLTLINMLRVLPA